MKISRLLTGALLSVVSVGCTVVAQHSPIAHASCGDPTPCVFVSGGVGSLVVSWVYTGGDADFYQLRWSENSGPEAQVTIDNGGLYLVPGFDAASYYRFKVQACQSRTLQSAVCTAWSDPAYYLPYGPDTCLVGYEWRGAFAGDQVCVLPSTQTEVAYDNGQAPYRVNPHGPYGPDTCLQGFVWRQAAPTDEVCVTPNARTQAAYDNSQAPYRRVVQ
jgi:hypothetical protein